MNPFFSLWLWLQRWQRRLKERHDFPEVPLLARRFETTYDPDGRFFSVTVLTRLDGAELPY